MTETLEKTVLTEDPMVLLKKYRETKDIQIRNQLVIHYSYIARIVSVQMRGIFANYAQMEDIVNQGILTIIDCIDKYEPDKEVKFESYAFMRIRDAIIDFIRKQDWIPRRVRKTAKDISMAHEHLMNEHMREPTTKEIAAYLNMSEKTVYKHYSEISSAVVLSFEGILENIMQTGANYHFSDTKNISPEDSVFKKEFRKILIEAIDQLSERERTVISLYYYENLKLHDIATVLEVSESRICQIHSKAILKLKSRLENYMKG